MTDLDELRAGAAEHARQIESAQWLDVKDLAQRWAISPSLVRRIDREKLPYIAFGETRARRYSIADVEAFEERERHAPTERAS